MSSQCSTSCIGRRRVRWAPVLALLLASPQGTLEAADGPPTLVLHHGKIVTVDADFTIAEVREEVPLGALDPEVIVTPSVYVDCYHVTG